MNIEKKTINSISGQTIEDDSIISNTSNGIVESTKSGWRFIPANKINSIVTNVSGSYETPNMPKAPNKLTYELYNEFSMSDDNKAEIENKFTYFLGIDSISVQYKELYKKSGIIFNNIALGTCSYIQVSANISISDKSAIEIYIIDGTKETSILPIETELVKNEKLFFNMPTRFTIDTKKPIEIRKDWQIIKVDINELDSLNLQNDSLYTISYTPLSAHSYFPDNSTIGIKIIQRLYDSNSETPYIKNISIHKYGGGISWTQ